MMSRIKRIMTILFVFISFSSLFSFLWFILENIILHNTYNSKYSDYILFFFGYGDAQNATSILKVIASIIGVITVSLISSVATVSLIEAHKRIIVHGNIIICRNDLEQYLGYKNFGLFLIHNKYSDIYKLNISLQLINDQISLHEDYYIPYVSKGETYIVRSNLDAGSIIFMHLQDTIENMESSVIILTAAYI